MFFKRRLVRGGRESHLLRLKGSQPDFKGGGKHNDNGSKGRGKEKRDRSQNADIPKGGGKGDGSNSGNYAKTQRFKTIKEAGGQAICTRYNDARGCSNKQCKYKHCCDCVLARGGGACGRSHPRNQHDEAKHGPVARY